MAKPDRLRVTHPVGGEVKTKQSFKDEVNINSIIKRWRDGVPLPEEHRNPTYGDFSDSGSFHEALERIRESEVHWMRLPSEIRAACEQDMGLFLDKVQTEEGLKEMIDLGLDEYQTPPGVEVPPDTPKRNPEPDKPVPEVVDT